MPGHTAPRRWQARRSFPGRRRRSRGRTPGRMWRQSRGRQGGGLSGWGNILQVINELSMIFNGLETVNKSIFIKKNYLHFFDFRFCLNFLAKYYPPPELRGDRRSRRRPRPARRRPPVTVQFVYRTGYASPVAAVNTRLGEGRGPGEARVLGPEV